MSGPWDWGPEACIGFCLSEAEKLGFELDAAGIYARNTRLFSKGDVFVMRFFNGQGERGKILGWSSKKNCFVVDLVVQYARHIPTQYEHRTGGMARVFGCAKAISLVDFETGRVSHSSILTRHPPPDIQDNSRTPIRLFYLPSDPHIRYGYRSDGRAYVQAGVRALWDSAFREPGRSQVARRLLPPPST